MMVLSVVDFGGEYVVDIVYCMDWCVVVVCC